MFWINAPRFCTTTTVGRRGAVDGVGGRGGIGGGRAVIRVILSPRLAITDLDRVILDGGYLTAGCGSTGVGSLFSSADRGVDWKYDGLETKKFSR